MSLVGLRYACFMLLDCAQVLVAAVSTFHWVTLINSSQYFNKLELLLLIPAVRFLVDHSRFIGPSYMLSKGAVMGRRYWRGNEGRFQDSPQGASPSLKFPKEGASIFVLGPPSRTAVVLWHELIARIADCSGSTEQPVAIISKDH